MRLLRRWGLVPVALFTFVAAVVFSTRPDVEIASPVAVSGQDSLRREGPDVERAFFQEWHEPYGPVLPDDVAERIREDVRTAPSENSVIGSRSTGAVNAWQCVGPYGMLNTASAGTRYTGRVLDVAPPIDGATTRVAAASGGLWEFFILVFLPIPVSMSDDVPSLATGTFAARPGDKTTILLGTGEALQRAGAGIWRTANSGTSWTNIMTNGATGAVYRIRYSPGSNSIVHAATERGYYRSTDVGLSWVRTLTGNVSDIAFDALTPLVMYAGRWGDTLSGGVYRSANGGLLWTKVIAPGIPTTNVGRTAVSVCASSPNVVYASLARNNDNNLLGVFRSTNAGVTWTNVSPPAADLGGNGWYNNVIAVCPTNANLVLLGWTNLLRTTNGGASWSKISTPQVHADHHALAWSADGAAVWNGNDGGLTYSSNGGVTWSTSGNTFAITQYYGFDVGVSNSGVIFGGSQDNGLSGQESAGATWNYTFSGDGGHIAIDPTDAARIFSTDGAFGGAILFKRQKSTSTGQSWGDFSSGISGDDGWTPEICADRQSPPMVYTNAKTIVYRSTSPYSSWAPLNGTGFSAPVNNLSVSRGGVVYACLASGAPLSRLMVYDGGAWYERSTGLPSGIRVRHVFPHPYLGNLSYALMNGFGSPGQKIFKSTNRGQTWTNATGDLPNVPVSDLATQPGSLKLLENSNLYLGTESGCFRSTNRGANWVKWNNGMSEATIVTSLRTIDSLGMNGKFYIVAGTFGRGIWKREVSGTDPLAVDEQPSLPVAHDLLQNYPNPFNPATNITFQLPADERIALKVFNVTGREVATLADGRFTAGTHTVIFDGSALASGVYFYRLATQSYSSVRKMVLVK
jgi:hypothetical protein